MFGKLPMAQLSDVGIRISFEPGPLFDLCPRAALDIIYVEESVFT
jgi:hypothetical protein